MHTLRYLKNLRLLDLHTPPSVKPLPIWGCVMINCIRVISCILACFILASSGCIYSGHLPSSDAYAPVDLSENSQVKRRIKYKTTTVSFDIFYSWVSKSGRKTHSIVVANEINNYLGGDRYFNILDPSLATADEAHWYWAPKQELVAERSPLLDIPLVDIRDDTIIVLAINPTVFLRVDRPAEFVTGVKGISKNSPLEWWGWYRLMLAYGIADGLVVPVMDCGDPWSYFTEIIIPSLDYRKSIDLNTPGFLECEVATIRWSCVSEGDAKSYFKFDIEAAETEKSK